MENNKTVIPDDVKMTPWLDQYREFKARYPDALLLFRMGDFYELFFDDAKTAASVLDIALTARDAEKKIPMAGVPHHALNIYLGRLISAGYRAAICEQIGDTPAKGIVERRVVRVVTPGTYVPEESGEAPEDGEEPKDGEAPEDGAVKPAATYTKNGSSYLERMMLAPDGDIITMEGYYCNWYDGPDDVEMYSDEFWEKGYDEYWHYEQSYYIRRLNPDGSEKSRFDLSGLSVAQGQDYFYVNSLQMDDAGRFYLIWDQTVILLDAEGNLLDISYDTLYNAELFAPSSALYRVS